MTKKQKKTLKRILAALVLTVLLAVVFPALNTAIVDGTAPHG